MNNKIFNQSLSNDIPFLYDRKKIYLKSSKNANFNSPSSVSKKQKHFLKTTNKKFNYQKTQNMGVKNLYNSIKLIKKKNESLPKYNFSYKKGFSIDKNDKLSRNDDNNLLSSSNILTIGNSSFLENINNIIYDKIKITNFNKNLKHNTINLKNSNPNYYDTNNFDDINLNSNSNIYNSQKTTYQRNYSDEKRKKNKYIFNEKTPLKSNASKRNDRCILKSAINRNIHKTYINKNDDIEFFSDNDMINNNNNKKANISRIKSSVKNFKDKNNRNSYKNVKNKNSIPKKRKIKVIKSIKSRGKSYLSYAEKVKYIIRIQSNFKGYLFKKKFYNTLNLYMRYNKAIFIIKKVFNSTKKLFIRRFKLKIKKKNQK